MSSALIGSINLTHIGTLIMKTEAQRDLLAALQSIALSIYEDGPVGLSLCELLDSSQQLIDISQELLDGLEDRV
jgi:hypothetical protein